MNSTLQFEQCGSGYSQMLPVSSGTRSSLLPVYYTN